MYKESKGLKIVYTVVLSITLILTGYLLAVQVFGNEEKVDDAGKRLIQENVEPHQADDASRVPQAGDAVIASRADEETPVNGASADKDAAKADSEPNAVLSGSGRYGGQADGNFIEITLTDDHGNASFRVFQLNDALKERFDSLGLETGDEITFTYEEREGQNPLLHTLEK